MLKIAQYPRNADSSPMDMLVAVLTDASGNAGARLTSPPVGPDGAPIDAVALVLVDATGTPINTSSSSSGYATRVAMAGAAGPVVGQTAQLGEPGREGMFYVALASAWTAAIAADPQQGVFVASTADATLVYVRWSAVQDRIFNVRHFGAKLDNATADGVAVAAACALSYAMRRLPIYAGIDYGNGGGASVYVPGLAYMNVTTLTFNHTFKFYGDSWGGPATQLCGLRWAAGATGIENPGRARIEGLALLGGFTAAEGEFHAIHATQPFPYRNLSGGNWQGDFMNLDDTTGGNVNGVVGENVWVYNCRDALNNMAGGDNNVCAHHNWNVSACRRWGIQDRTFLGNTHVAHEIDSCGITSFNDGVNIGCSVTTFSGNRYFVIAGQEVWCSTNTPTGTTADNQGWAYIGAGGTSPSFGILTWFNGMLCRAGGSYYIPGINIGSQILGCYSEGGQGFAQISSPSVVNSGAVAVWKGSPTFAPAAQPVGRDGQLSNLRGFYANAYLGTDEIISVQLGVPNATYKFVFTVTGTVSFPNTLAMTVNAGDLTMIYSGGGSTWVWTGPNTARAFGRSAGVPWTFWAQNIAIGPDTGSARIHTNGAVSPAAGYHAQGELCWNSAPVVGQPKGWMCTVSGTPGTWVSMGNL